MGLRIESMQKLFILFLLLTVSKTASVAQDYEEFDTLSRNDFVIHAGGGLGIYHLYHNDPNSETTLTAAKIFDIGASYFIANKINAGFVFNRLKYPTNQDSAQNANSSIVGLCIRYYTLNSKKTNIYIGINLGTTTFKFTNLKTNTKVTSGSLFLEPIIGFSHYWGKHIGVFIQSSYYYTKYDKIVNKDNEPIKVTVNGKKEVFWLAFSGMVLKTGILLKF
ncbi:MAG: hypothetical protein N2449_08170 [Bacteroidales bacterium]|nr:hypothetical protein [Bacteroidales bacterium]